METGRLQTNLLTPLKGTIPKNHERLPITLPKTSNGRKACNELWVDGMGSTIHSAQVNKDLAPHNPRYICLAHSSAEELDTV
jgi:hypothetical protein